MFRPQNFTEKCDKWIHGRGRMDERWGLVIVVIGYYVWISHCETDLFRLTVVFIMIKEELEKKVTASPSLPRTPVSATGLHTKCLPHPTTSSPSSPSLVSFFVLLNFQRNSMVGPTGKEFISESLSKIQLFSLECRHSPLPGVGWTSMPFLGY